MQGHRASEFAEFEPDAGGALEHYALESAGARPTRRPQARAPGAPGARQLGRTRLVEALRRSHANASEDALTHNGELPNTWLLSCIWTCASSLIVSSEQLKAPLSADRVRGARAADGARALRARASLRLDSSFTHGAREQCADPERGRRGTRLAGARTLHARV